MKIGTVRVKNQANLLNWYKTLSYQEAKAEEKFICDALSDKDIYSKYAKSAAYRQFSMSGVVATFEERWPEHHQHSVKLLNVFLSYNEQGLEIKSIWWNEAEVMYVYMGNEQTGFVFSHPERWFEFIPAQDWSNISPAEFKRQKLPAAASTDSLIAFSGSTMSLTKNDVEAEISDNESKIAGIKKEIDDVKQAKNQQLASLQKQIEALQKELQQRKEALLKELDRKMSELEEQKEKLENQIYLLDSQIFAIRCYAGETVDFIQVRAGRKAPETTPVVVHQKLRFLDEELGKLASLYCIQWNEMGLFEEFLRHSPVALDTFAPNERCVVLIRLSRTGKELGRSDLPGHENMLKQYQYFHGSAVGIIIRNGENVYLGWTDEDYIKIEDDVVNNIIDVSEEEQPERYVFERERSEYKQRLKVRRKKAMSDILSRVFVSNILQGIVDNSDILPLPAGTRFDKNSPYIQYAVADMWLDDARFGSFNDIIQRCNKTVAAGDIILTVQRLIPERDYYWGSPYRAWRNVRGRGDANRTHDCSVADCMLYPVNLVECDEPEKRVSYEKYCKANGKWERVTQRQSTFESEKKSGDIREDEIRDVEYYELPGEKHVYVSVEKTERNWRREEEYIRIPRANFELYEEEYINLTYMNSVWLSWAITQKKLGNWRIGGQLVNYAFGIRYLKKAMDYIREREENEKQLLDAIDPSVCQNQDWPIQLTEWKMDKGVRKITEYQAKRFVNAIKSEVNRTKG